MKKLFLIGIAALFLATGAAHAGSPQESDLSSPLIEESELLGAWHCEIHGTPGTNTELEMVDIELRKYATKDNAYVIRGQVSVWGDGEVLSLRLTDDMEVIFFNGVPCQQMKEGQ